MPIRAPLLPLPESSAPLLTPSGEHARFAPFRLKTAVTLIGNRSGVHVRLRSRQISGVHAVILCEQHRTFIRDLGSRTGIYVNGERTPEAELFPGDSLRIGPLTCEFTRNVRPASPQPPKPASGVFVFSPGDKRIEWDGRVLLIGRRQRSDLYVSGDAVSNVHALLCQLDGRFYIRDAGSRTGTYLNGAGVQLSEVHPGDKIRIGSGTLQCISKTGGPPPPPPRPKRPAEPVIPTRQDESAKPKAAEDDLIGEEVEAIDLFTDDEGPPQEWGPLAAAVGRTKITPTEAAAVPAAPEPKQGAISQFFKRLRR